MPVLITTIPEIMTIGLFILKIDYVIKFDCIWCPHRDEQDRLTYIATVCVCGHFKRLKLL